MKNIAIIKNQKIILVCVVVTLLSAFCLGGYIIRRNYVNQHYITLTMKDNGQIRHIQVSKERSKQIDDHVNKMYKIITEQVEQERRQKEKPH